MSKFFKSLGRKLELAKKKMNTRGDVSVDRDGDFAASPVGDSNAAMYNIVINPTFDEGNQGWFGMGCSLSVNSESGSSYAIGHGRTETWQGVAQEIRDRLEVDVEYRFEAWVGLGAYGPAEQANVQATVKVEKEDDGVDYNWIGSVTATKGQWVALSGKLKLSTLGKSSVLYIEGPPSGVDVLVRSVALIPTGAGGTPRAITQMGGQASTPAHRPPRDLLHNSGFEDGLRGWTQKGAKVYVTESLNGGAIKPANGKYFAVACNRTDSWQGIEQDITGRIGESTLYQVTGMVRVNGGVSEANVMATLYMKGEDGKDKYMTLGRVNASSSHWTELRGEFLVNKLPVKATIYIEGPPGGVDMLIDHIHCSPPERRKVEGPPRFQNPRFNVNIVKNSDFNVGLDHWYAQGNCRLNVSSGSPTFLGSCAINSYLETAPPQLSGAFLVVTNRNYDWEGPAQTITERLQLFMSYQVTAWVATRSPHQPGMKHKVDVCLSVDGNWVQGGEVLAGDCWTEVVGSFRLEKKPENVHVYLQGPGAGVDVMVAGLHIFAVDRLARVPMLQEQADKVRKRDVILRFKDANGEPLAPGTKITVIQTRSSFPIGSAINHYSLENKAYKKFFLDTFNWAVFENELKWGWIEPSQGELKYENADELLEFCDANGIPCRGHCILWETEDTIQDWLKTLPPPQLEEAVQSRVSGLLSRYQGRFRHYDVNNEMLHGSYYKDRLGPGFLPYLFKLAHQFDPEAVLFVNDYHIEDGCDCNSSPTKYIDHIKDLMDNGAPVGGIGLQGHIHVPVGPVIKNALDQLGALGLPIWLTEVDVESVNEFTRAEDLEVFLREAFAHPSVEGLMFWGFWEGTMSRKNAQLVDSDKRVNEAGLRLLALQKEWRTSIDGEVNDEGEIVFRGFLGEYVVKVDDFGLSKTFELVKGDELAMVELAF